MIRIDFDKKSKDFLVFIFVKDDFLRTALELWKTDKETYLF